MIAVERVPSPIGALDVATRDGALVYVSFETMSPRTEQWLDRAFPGETHRAPPGPTEAARAIARWFDDPRTPIQELPLDLRGSSFEVRAWGALLRVPLGRTASYGELARAVGEPEAAQAIGRAMGANPVPIVVPCHRCVGADGALTGFGGGLERKRWLLVHEGALLLSVEVTPKRASPACAPQRVRRRSR